ncbi:MAG: NFYB/HAP3 family transcription factor subunit [Candidatus Micrarchaeia archaeon]
MAEEDKAVAEAPEEEIPAEEEAKLPFPTARIVRIIKENLQKEHQIKSDVKIAVNKFLGEILADIARTMDKEELYTLSIEHFNKAARKYRAVDLQAKRIERIRKLLEKQRAELEEALLQLELSDEY